MVWGGSFLIAAAALKTPTRSGYNTQGVNLTTRRIPFRKVAYVTVEPSGMQIHALVF